MRRLPSRLRPPRRDRRSISRDIRSSILSHAFGAGTLYWPTSTSKFGLKQQANGPTPGGWFYSANTLSTPEHGGTHLDAPRHFAEKGRTADEIPLEQLVAPAVVIDVTSAGRRRPRLPADPRRLSSPSRKRTARSRAARSCCCAPGGAATGRTRKATWATTRRATRRSCRFRLYGVEAARLLVEERGVAALGIDTASIDYGRSSDFQVHRVAAARNVPGFENLTNLDRLPPRGAMIVALPMKIEGGSGGPLRAIALVPR